ncbi:MAG: ornithine carbamoyltransferase, partial [Planctomycetota bacterium]|nr:ornithine carbamoyltransferase [Planctomycetota bacterium]
FLFSVYGILMTDFEMRHFLSLIDYSSAEIQELFDHAIDLKSKFRLENRRDPILNRCVAAMIFEKQSLRTRVSFETGIQHLGGSCLYLSGDDVGWGGEREAIRDFSSVLSSYVDIIICRAKSHQSVVELSENSSCPVINALTDLYHPCQSLADALTMMENCDDLQSEKLAFIGDANNVSRSLAIICAKLGIQFSVASPQGYQFDDCFVEQLLGMGEQVHFNQTLDPVEAVDQAGFVYTDVWTSMGQEVEKDERRAAFKDYQVNARLMSCAKEDAKFLHCLPANRGEEVTDEVMDSPNSLVIQQAENRMHAQKGLMTWLLGPGKSKSNVTTNAI